MKELSAKNMHIDRVDLDEYELAGLVMTVEILQRVLQVNDLTMEGEDRRSLYAWLAKMQSFEILGEVQP